MGLVEYQTGVPDWVRRFYLDYLKIFNLLRE